jgi:hypothetical protein
VYKVEGQPDVVFLRALVDDKVKVSYPEIVCVCVVAAALGVLLTLDSTYKIHSRLARRLRITKKFGELDVWGYVFNSRDVQWATVRDHKNDVVYEGWVSAFSDDSKSAELLLRDVSVYKNSTSENLYQVGAAYISRHANEMTIEFRDIEVGEKFKWEGKDDEQEGSSRGD